MQLLCKFIGLKGLDKMLFTDKTTINASICTN